MQVDHMDPDSLLSMDGEGLVDTHFRADMVQGRMKQRSLRNCGFINVLEQQLDRCNDEAMEALHTAWPVLLGQMAVTKPHSNLTQRLVCTLSQVSQGMRSTVTVLAQAASHLSVDLMSWREPRKMLNSFARWLPRHAALVKDIDSAQLLTGQFELDCWLSAESVLARAMWEAGSRLQLTRLACTGGVLERAGALQGMRSCLRDLVLTIQDGCITDAEAQPMVQALRQLTSLDSLTICAAHCTNERNVNKLLPALSGLTKLTYLSAGFNRHADLTTYLPPSLVELYLGSAPLSSDPPAIDEQAEDMAGVLPSKSRASGQPLSLGLGHLTAVTYLDFLWDDQEDEWEPLYLGDQLPPNLRNLSVAVRHGAAVGVLWPLTQLTYLQLAHRNLSAAHLQSLSVLKSLKVAHMFLHDPTDATGMVERVETPEDYCEAWPLLRSEAWQHIDVDNGVVTPRVLHSVGHHASHITRLQLYCHSDSTATHHDLAAALAPLKLLKSLDVQWVKLTYWQQVSHVSRVSSPAISSCAKAVASMAHLTSLSLRHLPLPRSAAVRIASLQQLTSLDLSCCLLDNYAVNVIALRLTGLEVLALEGNTNVTDASMPTVATLMQQLKSLDMRHTGITADGRGWLQRGLPGLRTMRVCGRSVPGADALRKAWPAVHTYCAYDQCPHRRALL